MSEKTVFEQFDEVEATRTTRSERWNQFVDLWVVTPVKIALRDRRTRWGALIILFYLFLGTVGVVVTEPPAKNEGPVLAQPLTNPEFPLGTDGFGQDIIELMVHSTPAMLKMMIAGGVFATVIGVIVGTLAGYKRGRTERVLTTMTDTMMAIPGLPLLMVLAIALQPEGPVMVGVLLSVTAWSGLARQLHSEVLSTRNEAYVESARVIGASTPSIIRDDILPNIMPFIMINFMGNSIRVIHASVGLYFLGILPFTQLNWGVVLNLAFYNGGLLSWRGLTWIIAPIFMITLLGYGVTLFSQGMDQLFNPRIRARHARTTSSEGAVDEPEEETIAGEYIR